MLGVPFDNVTVLETVALIERMIASRRPHYLVTANVDFLVQAAGDVELRRILFESNLVLCDGTPLLWASRWLGNPLPERVAGSDLVPLLVGMAAERGYRLFLLGGSPESTSEAVVRLQRQHPNLVIAGHYSPPFQSLLQMDHEEITRRIRAAEPDILLVAFGCPKQEKWISMHYRSLRVPVSIGVGGTIDFLAGRLARAPHWMQRTGTEWAFRLAQEPRRLFKRYAKDLCWFGVLLGQQWCRMQFRTRRRPKTPEPGRFQPGAAWHQIAAPEWLDAAAVQEQSHFWHKTLEHPGHVLLNLAAVEFIDSTGLGLLVRLRKEASLKDRQLILLSPSAAVTRALKAMRLWPFFVTAANDKEAHELLLSLSTSKPAVLRHGPSGRAPALQWQGDITAGNAPEVWQLTDQFIAAHAEGNAQLTIDLAKVTFIDSTGLGLMVRGKKRAENAGTRLQFVAVQDNVQNVLRLAKLEAYLLER
jgi:N-acetylglucosaminyldiphosphoundecaprenol N-acetyl-beta-D-mannosaminyltransferase